MNNCNRISLKNLLIHYKILKRTFFFYRYKCVCVCLCVIIGPMPSYVLYVSVQHFNKHVAIMYELKFLFTVMLNSKQKPQKKKSNTHDYFFEYNKLTVAIKMLYNPTILVVSATCLHRYMSQDRLRAAYQTTFSKPFIPSKSIKGVNIFLENQTLMARVRLTNWLAHMLHSTAGPMMKKTGL